jgi:serine/threonine protein kinase
MPAPTTVSEFLELVQKSGVLDEKKLDAYVEKLRATPGLPSRPTELAGYLVRDGLLTHFQAEQLLQGKWRRFTIGKYKVLERLGSGGMGSVYLCEHKLMRRRVAVKVLPTAKADDPSSLERFYREARAVAALDHPNIVRAYDIDQDEKLHFLVMEYVDGSSLQEIVKRSGPLDPVRAAHYVRQSALGLQHAHEAAGLVHRDIKPGNILVDRGGTVKVLDMGLARFFHDEEDVLTKKYDENVLGTADYLAPEQALDSHAVDIRADIYSLGATFYFCLTGKTPFSEGTVAQKLIWHQTRQPKPIRSVRADVPDELVAVIDRMMAKEAGQRYQTPLQVAEALAPWTQAPIAPPTDTEMPRLSLAALGEKAPSDSQLPGPGTTAGVASPTSRKTWQVSSTPSPRPPSSGPTIAQAPTQPTRPAAQPVRPAATPAPTARPGVAAVAPATEEEAGEPWEKLAPETDNPVGQVDTAPSPGDRASSPALRSSVRRTLPPVRMRPWWEMVLVGLMIFGGVAAAVTALVVWLAFRHSGTPPTAPPGDSRPLVVSRAGGPGTIQTLEVALKKARAGCKIVIQDPTIDEEIHLDNFFPKGVTIEGEEGQTVVWTGPKGGDDASALCNLAGVEDLHLRHLTLDGGGRRDKLILITGKCPGLTLDDLDLRGFKRCAVLIMNCAGTADRPVTFKGVRTSTAQEAEAALLFDINTHMLIRPNQYFRIQDCRFEGPYKDPIRKKDTEHLDSAGKNVHVVGGKENPL